MILFTTFSCLFFNNIFDSSIEVGVGGDDIRTQVYVYFGK